MDPNLFQPLSAGAFLAGIPVAGNVAGLYEHVARYLQNFRLAVMQVHSWILWASCLTQPPHGSLLTLASCLMASPSYK
jgi:hypothetical protein